MTSQAIGPDDVLRFWFGLSKEAHFTKDPVLDAQLTARFGEALEAAKTGVYDSWCSTPEGALALVILLDQFSRNIHRNTSEMFAGDEKALNIAGTAIAVGALEQLPVDHRQWLVMPFMHSEDLDDQKRCIEFCRQAGLDEITPYAITHADIIRKFGRFPHRNELLNRDTTHDELKFLDRGGFAG